MSGRDVFMALSTVLGGLALFLLGISIMTDGHQQAAGKRLRQVLSSVARSRSGIGSVVAVARSLRNRIVSRCCTTTASGEEQ